MLIKCAFVGHKNFDIYRNARYYNNNKKTGGIVLTSWTLSYKFYNQNVIFLKLVILQSSSVQAERKLKGPLKSKKDPSQWTEYTSSDQHLPIEVMD
jgi:hypothetical protein